MKKKSASRSAFFDPRVLISFGFCLTGILLGLLGFGLWPSRAALAQEQPTLVQGQYQGLSPVAHFDISPPLRDIKPIPPGPGSLRENEDQDIVPRNFRFAFEPDPVVQSTQGGMEIPAPIVSFNGQPNSFGGAPPDPNGDVGPNHVVAMANLSFQIFNKTGTSLFGPAANNTLWSGFGGPCQTQNAGDPVVLYDQLADRWLLSQFTSGSAPFFNCIAVSTTPNPTGTYFRYAIMTGTTGANFPDYPKYGVWPDAYYISTREFLGSGGPFQGVGAYALNRAQMLAGNPTPQVIFFIVAPGGTSYNIGDGLLPADLDGSTLPPAGSNEYYLGSMDNNGPYGAPQDALTLWKFHVDFAVPANSTFTLANTINTASFNSILALCGGGRACIPQPGTTNRIDHLGYRQRPLHRLAYRNFGTHESLVTNQSVSAGTGPSGEVSGIRWWELRSPNVAPVIFQQGTYAPGLTDGVHRWMGSIAMDGEGNMGLSYSASNGSVFPSVSYTGRLAGSALGTMPLGENSIVGGTGSQTGANRWGDYSSLTVDPADDLTFWAVNEYVPTTSSTGWRLRIGSFKVSSASPTPTPTSTPTTTPTSTPIVPTPTPTPPTPTPTSTPIVPTPTPTPATPTPTPTSSPILVATVSLPIATVNTSVTNFAQPVVTSAINAADSLVGFQGDFTFDSSVVSFQSPVVSGAGLTASNWNVSGNVLNTGPGTTRTLRVSAFSNDFTPLSGSGTLFNLNMIRMSSTPGASTPLTWAAPPQNFIFVDDDLDSHAPGNTPPGSITIIQATITISGTVSYCSNPVPGPVPGVSLNLTGDMTGSTTTDGSGNYTLSSVPAGGNYTVTPTKNALAPGSADIDTIDVVAVQRHFLNIALLPPGCRLMAADVNNDTVIDTIDVIAVQRFFLGLSTGIANTGKYQFAPANRTYTAVGSNQTGQNYDALIFGDVAAAFAHRPDSELSTAR